MVSRQSKQILVEAAFGRLAISNIDANVLVGAAFGRGGLRPTGHINHQYYALLIINRSVFVSFEAGMKSISIEQLVGSLRILSF